MMSRRRTHDDDTRAPTRPLGAKHELRFVALASLVDCDAHLLQTVRIRRLAAVLDGWPAALGMDTKQAQLASAHNAASGQWPTTLLADSSRPTPAHLTICRCRAGRRRRHALV